MANPAPRLLIVLPLLLVLAARPDALAADPPGGGRPEALGKVGKSCVLKGKKLSGKIQVVTAFPDLKVQVVTAFPDLKVQVVTSFPDSCGKWQMVTAFPDLKVQFVTAFPDLTIQYVDAFPGVP